MPEESNGAASVEENEDEEEEAEEQASCSSCCSRRARRATAVAGPVLDAAVALGVLLGVTRQSSATPSFGWTSQAPLVFCLFRMLWLIALASLASLDRSCSRLKQVEKVLEIVFPYVFSLAFFMLGIVRLVTDEPADVSDVDARGFWTASLLGAACLVIETYFTLEALTLLRARARRRMQERERAIVNGSRDRLGVEAGLPLAHSSPDLGAAASAPAGGSPGGSPSGPDAAARKEKERKERAEKKEKERKEREQRRPTVRKMLKLIVADWHILLLAALFLCVAAISETLLPHFVGETISSIIRAEERGTLAQRPFKGPVISLLITAACCGVFSSLRGASFICMGGRASVRIRQALFDSLVRQEIGFYDTQKTGEITSRLTQDCQKVSDQVTINVNVFLRTLVQIVSTLSFMLSLSSSLTSVAFISIPVVVVLSKKYGGVMQNISSEVQKSLAEANAIAEESLSHMATVRMFAAEQHEAERFGAKLAGVIKLTYRAARFYIIYLTFTILLPNGVTALVLFYGGKLAMEGKLKANILLSFVFYLQTLNANFGTLGDFYTNMVQALGAATRAFELQNRTPELPLDPPEGTAATMPRFPEGALRLEGVRFNYPARPDTEVLKGLSLEVPAGQVVSLVGHSGNGKSTVFSLMKRLYKAKEGRVLLDGVDIWDFSHASFHRVVSIVGQEPVLFARTIRENILYGLDCGPSPSSAASPHEASAAASPASSASSAASRAADPPEFGDLEVSEAATKANVRNEIERMSKGFDSEVGENGVQLSGGQKQRIAIARALVRRPKVLLLDEATSALDAESERQVQEAIDKMVADGSMTVVIIAHRLSTVRNSHKICVINGGEVVEEGRHEELVAKGGAYYRLVECQLSGSGVSIADTAAAGGGAAAAAADADADAVGGAKG